MIGPIESFKLFMLKVLHKINKLTNLTNDCPSVLLCYLHDFLSVINTVS